MNETSWLFFKFVLIKQFDMILISQRVKKIEIFHLD